MRSSKSSINPECPAIAELADTLEKAFPDITLFTTNNVSPGTRHTAGVAIDIMADVTKAEQRRRAHHIMNALVANWSALRWSDLIYSDFDGSSISYFHIPAAGGFGGPIGMLRRNPYTSDTRHGDHIHLDWVDFSLKNDGALAQRIPYRWSDAAHTTGFAGQLASALAAAPASLSAPSGDAGANGWLQGWWKVVDGNTYYYFFSSGLEVFYTKTEPQQSSQPMRNPMNRGRCVLAGTGTTQNLLTIEWNPADGGSTREVFTRLPGRSAMGGTSNRYAPLWATKMFTG
jgi:hypothetical protein